MSDSVWVVAYYDESIADVVVEEQSYLDRSYAVKRQKHLRDEGYEDVGVWPVRMPFDPAPRSEATPPLFLGAMTFGGAPNSTLTEVLLGLSCSGLN
jgi:hypothetical protein